MHSDTSNNRGEQLNNFGSGSARLFRRAAMATRMITLMLLCLLLLLATTSQLTQGQTESVIYSFCSESGCSDGANPQASLLLDAKGFRQLNSGLEGEPLWNSPQWRSFQRRHCV
jgi:hypothetical protein